MFDVLELTKELIRRPSLTPNDAGCQLYLAELLKTLGFILHWMPSNGVSNLWAVYGGTEGPLFCFAGHTDVVPVGDLKDWTSPPFEPTLVNGKLYGRGAADMKSGLAAMLTATAAFLKKTRSFKGRIAFLITSDEEGSAQHGTRFVMSELQKKSEKIEWCVVGEPSSLEQFGDTIRIGRRGTLTAYLTIIGKQGHVAYPHLAQNPIHLSLPFFKELIETEWDLGHAQFPATSLQIANMQAGTGANNVIPGTLTADFNFRYNPSQSFEKLEKRVVALLKKHQLTYNIRWVHSGEPFLTDEKSSFIQKTIEAIDSVTGIIPTLSTGGGTSDARFIAPTGAQVVEIGVLNASIHQVNEHVLVDDIIKLERIFIELLRQAFIVNRRSLAKLKSLKRQG
jgi:succinyl-diaminopimelate desuccinylase